MTSTELMALIELVRLAGQPDPAAWTAQWIEIPHAKLAGRRPVDFFTSRSARLQVYAVAAADVAIL